VLQPPSGTVTFLFTDIEGSTRLWEERPDDMRALVATHDERFRAVIEGNGGYVVKTTGDGVHAAFGRAADAVAAAEQCQEALADLPDIRVRMGINTGEVQERAGDYFGPPVNRAARLMAAGHGGQVLISAVTAELVPDLVLRNLGEHRLRDLGSPMVVLQLGTEEFPALQTLDELPGNLPVQRTSFVGRVDEVKELSALVETVRLVTLTGPGGVGKSRLALQVAAEVAPLFHDGVWFASLSALEEGALVAATILESLGVPERRGEPAVDTLCAWASARDALVVIDNCEHLLVEVATVVDRVMEVSTTVAIVATSQAPLGLRGEHARAVAPLSGPRGGSRDSVELFVDRARMARGDFDLTDDNEAAVVEICDRLDHVPLAIELAAARVRGMAPADIARRLDQRLRLLASSDRLAPGRHRTLDAAVRWSYELLDDTQQRVFDRLSVFAGPFTVEAAETVVAGDGVEEWEVLDGVLALVDKSLVVADEEPGGTRYRLLETMRQFGQANLAAGAINVLYRDRHADYYADYVLSRCPQLYGSGDQGALDDIERELENIRLSLRQSADDHESSRFEEVYGSLDPLWLGRSRAVEGAAWAAELQLRPNLDPGARIAALGAAANVVANIDLAEAEAMAGAAIALWEATGAARPLRAMTVIAQVATMQGRSVAAIEQCDRILGLAAEEPDLYMRAQAFSGCYSFFVLCHAFDRLDPLERELTPLLEQLGNRGLEAGNGSAAAMVAYFTQSDRAGDVLRRSYALFDEVGSHGTKASMAMFLALNELRAGDDVEAARWARDALQLAVDHGPAYIAQIIDAIVAIVKRHSVDDAAVLFGALRSERVRRQQAGTEDEINAEARYEASFRRRLGERFEALNANGQALDERAMIALAFTQLDAITQTHDRAEGAP
jgi:predicted ATPase